MYIFDSIDNTVLVVLVVSLMLNMIFFISVALMLFIKSKQTNCCCSYGQRDLLKLIKENQKEITDLKQELSKLVKGAAECLHKSFKNIAN